VAAEVTEEEECDGCDSADPQRCLDDSLLHLADRILLRSIVTTTAQQRLSPATTTTSMPAIDIGALFIGREDWEGNNSSGVTKEDDDETDAEAGGCSRDFLEVVLRQHWEGRFGRRRTTTKTTETSRDDEHEDDVVTRSIVRASRRRRCLRLARSADRRQRPWRGRVRRICRG
jgi:hypothetical protein